MDKKNGKCLTVTVFNVHSGLCLQQQRQEVSCASESRMMKSWKTEEKKIRKKSRKLHKNLLETVKSYLDLWTSMFLVKLKHLAKQQLFRF